jgi:hypothetical protein
MLDTKPTPEMGFIITEESLKVPVMAHEKKTVFGRELLLVTPIGGSGTKWVNADRWIERTK